jgi:phosphoglucomutase
VADLSAVLDLDVLRGSKLRLGVDPLGGAGVAYWGMIAERYGIPLTVVSEEVDPTFRFMSVDWDGRIRMDCSSPYAMRRLIAMQERFDVAWACDPDHDRHGIVSRSAGLMNPNHYLAVAIEYLFQRRDGWSRTAAVGKTVVSSSMIDRVAASIGRRLVEVPVGFKWFVDGLIDGSLGFGGEESAGASFLRRDGRAWSTDKDGIILACSRGDHRGDRRDPGELYAALTERFGAPAYERIDAPAIAGAEERACRSSTRARAGLELAGEPIVAGSPSRPGTARRSGAQGRHREWLVRRARLPAPRTCTSSMRRASRDGAPAADPGRGEADHLGCVRGWLSVLQVARVAPSCVAPSTRRGSGLCGAVQQSCGSGSRRVPPPSGSRRPWNRVKR